jgi:hypothetical protein
MQCGTFSGRKKTENIDSIQTRGVGSLLSIRYKMSRRFDICGSHSICESRFSSFRLLPGSALFFILLDLVALEFSVLGG